MLVINSLSQKGIFDKMSLTWMFYSYTSFNNVQQQQWLQSSCTIVHGFYLMPIVRFAESE